MDFAFDAVTEDYRDRLLGFMDAHVYPNESAYYREIGELEDPAPDPGVAPGERRELMLRPEHLLLDPAAPLRVRVLDSRFRGADVLHTVELPSGRRLLAIAPGDREYPAG